MRFFGEIGYGVPVKIRPGVWEDQITERSYYGDVEQDTLTMQTNDSVLPKSTFQTSISVVADAHALENYTAIRYVKWAGSRWVVTSVKLSRPRLLLMLGEVYNGPTPSAPDSP